MARDDTADPPAAEGTGTGGPTTAELAARQDSLEGKLDQILTVLGKGEGKAQGSAAEHEENKLDAPTSVADEIRRQLEAKEAKDRAAAEADQHAAWRTGVDTKIAELTEQKPETPPRRIEKIMWGAR